VVSDVLVGAGIKEETAKKIYKDSVLGMSTVDGLEKWVKLSLTEDRSMDAEFEAIRAKFNLSSEVVERLVGPYSTLSHFIQAVKGSVRAKLASRDYNYECQEA